REVYITAAIAGATVFVVMDRFGVPFWAAAITGALVAFGVRAGALTYGWSLPPYRSRPGRDARTL
ncbi:MAG TPA: trimeric intracellular cation channel family protein, partial [Methylomirabilota bacterium]|nr:trimeric intracellular cation channel family protein [Methylomirabilota bacterium]